MRLLFRYKIISALFIGLTAIYLAETLSVAPDKAALVKYSLTSTQFTWIVLSFSLPYVVIWFIALVGYLRFRSYTEVIKNSKDGSAFSTISKGLLLLSLWLPVAAALSAVATRLYTDHPSYTPTMVILVNYLNIAMLLPAFLIINRGARKLLSTVKPTANAISQRSALLFICFSALYVMITLEDRARHAPTHSVSLASYYLPDWLIIITIVIPRLVMWFLGVQAVENIYLYGKKTKGKIYKLALKNVAVGIGVVIIATITLRCIQSLSSPIGELSLSLVLLLYYILITALGIGYVLIYKGTKQLQKIEDL